MNIRQLYNVSPWYCRQVAAYGSLAILRRSYTGRWHVMFHGKNTMNGAFDDTHKNFFYGRFSCVNVHLLLENDS
jgi:hypothetical protein